MTDFADDSSISMNANFAEDNDDSKTNGKNVSNSDLRENDINDENSKTDDEFDNKDNNDMNENSMALTKANDDEERKLFLGGLSWDTEEKDLREYFGKFGQVVDVSIKYDAVSGNPRGFGFITFAAEEPIEEVLKTGPHVIHGKTVDPKRAKSRPICKKIFVGGVDASMTEDDIKKYFQRFGTVEGIELPFDRQRNRRREFCFIIFDTEEAAEAAVKEAKQTIGNKECDIKKAQPQPVAQQQKRMQQQNHGYDAYESGSGTSSSGNRRGGGSGRRNQSDQYQSGGQWGYNGAAAAQNYYQNYYGNQYPNAYGYPNQGYDYYSQYGYTYGDYWNYYGYGDGTAVAGDYTQTGITDGTTAAAAYGTTAQPSSQSSTHSHSHQSGGTASSTNAGKILRKSGTSSTNYHPYPRSAQH
jgi:squid-like protein